MAHTPLAHPLPEGSVLSITWDARDLDSAPISLTFVPTESCCHTPLESWDENRMTTCDVCIDIVLDMHDVLEVSAGHPDDTETCPSGCGERRVTESGSNAGFAGEGVWWANLSCGHSVMESGSYDGR